ncbi:hypothetical protein DL93DRAFT_2082765, partial [Clavulina sp. PMI_390]
GNQQLSLFSLPSPCDSHNTTQPSSYLDPSLLWLLLQPPEPLITTTLFPPSPPILLYQPCIDASISLPLSGRSSWISIIFQIYCSLL